MNRTFLAMAALSAVFAGAAGCSSSSAQGTAPANPPIDAAGDALVEAGPFDIAVACSDTVDAVYGEPGALTGERGQVLRCAHDRDLTRDALESLARADTYQGLPLTSGAHVYRISYRTERAPVDVAPKDAAAGPPGYSSALLLIPDTPRAAKLPAIVASHGTGGQGGVCTPTKSALDQPADYFALQFLALAGAGYAVIAPDYAGFANYGAPGNPPSGYASSADEGRSILDAARALRQFIPQGLSDKVVLVGHSQGGHGVLSALALSNTYGAGGALAGVVAYSPLWFNQGAWGAMPLLGGLFPIPTNHFTISVGLWYHYSHGELLDGAGHGVDVFAAGVRAQIKTIFDTDCGGADLNALDALGQNVGDLYDPGFIQAVGPSAVGSPCPASDSADAPLCNKWMARYAADRPHLTGEAAGVPILVVYGTGDTTIPPERAVCGFDRLKADGASAKICVVPGATHGSIVSLRADHVNDWIAEKALGAVAPMPCDESEGDLQAEAGAPIACATPPPND